MTSTMSSTSSWTRGRVAGWARCSAPRRTRRVLALHTVSTLTGQQLVMNVALGFDTFLVMRHGSTPDVKEPAVPVSPGQPYRGRLGCYYCNDIVAPMDVRPFQPGEHG